MPAFKKQHYLPAAYLKQFAADKSAKPARKSQVWRFDGRTSRQVPAESQCFERWFYTKDEQDGETIEKAFGEGCFAECARRIRDGKPPADGQFFGLIGIIFDLCLRNAAQDNLTGKSNLDAYHVRLSGLKQGLVGGEYEPTDETFRDHMKSRWQVRVLSASDGNEFITSDNPSILMQDWDYAILPVTPLHVAIAFDCVRIEVGTHATAADGVVLNELQFSNAVKCVYSSVALNAEQKKRASEWLSRKRRFRSETNEQSWTVVTRTLAPGVKFSFLRNRQGS